jgi:hypothetical protein
VGCVFILVSVMTGPIMRGRSGVPHKNQKLTRIVTAVLGFMILLFWYLGERSGNKMTTAVINNAH